MFTIYTACNKIVSGQPGAQQRATSSTCDHSRPGTTRRHHCHQRQ